MKTIFVITITALFAVGLSSGCQTNPANQTVDKTGSNINQPANQANSPETNKVANETEAKTNSPGSNDANTPTAAYKAAYAARKNRDVKALKQLISKDMFEFFEILGDGKPNAVDEGLKEFAETPQGASDETRNEKIIGDKATLEYLDKSGDWKTIDLVKEDGGWKLTIGKMEQNK